MSPKINRTLWLLGLALCGTSVAGAAQLQILLPLGRTAYQTNEQIDVSIVRGDTAPLAAGVLTMTLTGADASKIALTFPTEAVQPTGGQARVTEHLHLNGWLLRPGVYKVDVASDGATATTQITLVSHVRMSTFKTLTWGTGAQGNSLALQGQNSLGFNLIEGDFWPNAIQANGQAALLGQADFMETCTMGGAHQMEMDAKMDWSDPFVIRGGRSRVSHEAQVCRTFPNTYGVHFYDEPGLTWQTNAVTGKNVPFNIPSQDDAYRKTFGVDPPEYYNVKADDPTSVARWNQLGRWKEEFMEAAWREAREGVEQVNPNYMSMTQSQYAWNAYTDGYYFNVVRSLPGISGHGGYDDGPASYYYPSYCLEFGRMRELNKPDWYLPNWYVHPQGELFRLEQYLSFQNDIQGMATPPWLQIETAQTSATASVVESNKIFAKLGPIFNVIPVNRGDVAVLYSISQDLGGQIESGMTDDYLGGGHARGTCLQVYLAGKMLHVPFFPIVEEDVLDGTLAANHKAVIVAGINYLDPKVVTALSAYAAGGGTVIETDDCKVIIPGVTKLGFPASPAMENKIETIWATDQQASVRLRAATVFMNDAKPLAAALGAKLKSIGINPVAVCADTNIAITREAQGDIEYLFAVNATGDYQAKMDAATAANAIKAATAKIAFDADSRPIYDAVRGGVPVELPAKATAASFRFGPGEMRVFARTARPIGFVQVSPVVQFKDFTVAENPINIKVSANLEDTSHVILSGAAPMEIKVLDPLGVPRYDLYRSTDNGNVAITLPLAANDPAGAWKVSVTELLDNHVGTGSFVYKPGSQCGALSGASPRAVYFGDDRKKIYDFVRHNQIVTIAVGSSPYDAVAAQRLADSLHDWGVTSTIVDASTVTTPAVTATDAVTMIGFDQGVRAHAGTDNSPIAVGFNIKGGAILIGNPTDNPLIKFAQDHGFMAYTTTADFPGAGHGYIGWQSDVMAVGKESITLIANDAAGMNEAAGTAYEAIAGLEPLTTLNLPLTAMVTPASVSTVAAPPASIAWTAILPDRAISVTKSGANVQLYTLDGTLNTIDPTGKVLSSVEALAPVVPAVAAKTAPAPPAVPADKLAPRKIVKQVIATPNGVAIAYWGGTIQTYDAKWNLKTEQLMSEDITGIVWQGSHLVVGLSDGKVVALNVK